MKLRDMPWWKRWIIGFAILVGPGVAFIVLAHHVPIYAMVVFAFLGLFVQTRLIRWCAQNSGYDDDQLDD